MFSPIEEILEDLRAGKMIVLVDDENRENEGDLICAAESVTPQIIHFMTRHTPGYLCVALPGETCDRLGLHPQTGITTATHGTAMAVSVDGHPRHNVGTGIAASDRAKTARLLADPDSRPDDLVRPGHMVPLRARDGGVLVRTGQTEGSVDLVRLAGLHPASVISEISRDDGEMARLPELIEFCKRNELKICTVEQVIEYRLARERLITRMAPREGDVIETPHGRFNLIAFQTTIDPQPHMALTVGEVGALNGSGRAVKIDDPVLVRMHRRDVLGDIFLEQSNPTGHELQASLRMIQQAGRGVLVYLRPEGSGSDLRNRLIRIQRPNGDDPNAPDLTRLDGPGGRAQPMDKRDFGVGVQILLELGLSKIRVLTNHPRALPGLHAFGLEVVEHVPIVTDDS